MTYYLVRVGVDQWVCEVRWDVGWYTEPGYMLDSRATVFTDKAAVDSAVQWAKKCYLHDRCKVLRAV